MSQKDQMNQSGGSRTIIYIVVGVVVLVALYFVMTNYIWPSSSTTEPTAAPAAEEPMAPAPAAEEPMAPEPAPEPAPAPAQ